METLGSMFLQVQKEKNLETLKQENKQLKDERDELVSAIAYLVEELDRLEPEIDYSLAT